MPERLSLAPATVGLRHMSASSAVPIAPIARPARAPARRSPIALASEHLTSPAQLQGKTVGITGVPSDTAVLDTVVRGAGGDPAKVHVVNVGFDGAKALVAGRIAAFLGYWPADGVQLAVNGHAVTSFKLDRYGGPAYPGLVAFTDRSLTHSNPGLVRAFVAATVHGYTTAFLVGACIAFTAFIVAVAAVHPPAPAGSPAPPPIGDERTHSFPGTVLGEAAS